MKFASLLIVSILFFSCHKVQQSGSGTSNPIYGKWVWEKSFGGITGFEETPANSGKVITLELFSNGVYRYSLNKVMPKVGNFVYQENNGNGYRTIQFDQEPEQMITELNAFHLEYGSAPVDGISHRYLKQ